MERWDRNPQSFEDMAHIRCYCEYWVYMNDEVIEIRSSWFEEKHCNLSHIEIDEVLGLVSDIGPKVPANHTVPCWIIFLVKLLLYVGSNVLLNVEFLQGNVGTVNRILLHLLVHVCVLYHCFPLSCRHNNQIIFIWIISFRFITTVRSTPLYISIIKIFGGFKGWMRGVARWEGVPQDGLMLLLVYILM